MAVARFTVLLGGARSGKSELACRLAAACGGPATYLATAEGRDDEMAERLERHRADRPEGWGTVEEPVAVVDAVASIDGDHTLVLDCLTLWVGNLLAAGWDDWACHAEAARLAEALSGRAGRSVVVANEVGCGIVPADPATRRFRDVHGRVNRVVAELADEALLIVAGRVLPLLAPSRHWELDV